jgi:hypothetical protein
MVASAPGDGLTPSDRLAPHPDGMRR